MNVFRIVFFLILSSFTLGSFTGCTKGDPTFGLIDQNAVPQPMFNGTTSTTIIGTAATQTYAIAGQCDPKIRDITAMAKDVAQTYVNLTSVASSVTVNCATSGTFAFTMQSLTALGFTPVDGNTYDVYIRAVTSAGVSNPSIIHVYYSTSGGNGPKLMVVTSGSTESSQNGERMAVGTSNTFKATIRVSHALNDYTGTASQDQMSLKTSPNFQMKSGVAAQAD